MRYKKYFPFIFILVAATLLTAFFWQDLFWQPNQQAHGGWGDGIKNYFTTVYHAKHDTSSLRFNGMWYPYGEHIQYTELPALAIGLQYIEQYVFPIADYGVGIINSVLFISVIIGIGLMYLILRHYYLPAWYAFMIALLVGFLAPQFTRVGGHYGLAIFCSVPLLWYFLIQLFDKNKPVLYGLLLGGTSFCLGYLHGYYLLISAAFILSYCLIYGLRFFGHKQFDRTKWVTALLAGTLPILSVRFLLLLIDGIGDRHPVPWGYLHYNASFESIFLPVYDPFLSVWNSFIKVSKPNWEGWAYVGFIGLLVLLFTVVKWGNYIRLKQFKRIVQPVLPKDLGIVLWASVLVLIFSMGFPFKLGLEWLYEYIPNPIKQFRSIGRFAWVFYYVFSVYAAVYIYQIYRRLRQKQLYSFAFFALFFFLLQWSLDSYLHVKKAVRDITNVAIPNPFIPVADNYHPYKQWLEEAGYQVADFQAILSFPHYNIGSEKIYFGRSGSAEPEACKAAYDTGLPTISGYLSRTSVSVAMKSSQLLSSPFIKKKILADFNDKPILLVVPKDPLYPEEQRLLNQAELIKEHYYVNTYKLPLSAFADKTDSIKTVWKTQQNRLWHFPNYSATEQVTDVVIRSFDEGEEGFALYGKKSIYQRKGNLMLWDAAIPNGRKKEVYEASVWVYAGPEHAGFPILYYQQKNEKGEVVEKKEVDPKRWGDIYGGGWKGYWVKAVVDFSLQDPENTIELILRDKFIRADELLIRPKQTDVFYQNQGEHGFMYNGFVIE